MVIHWRIRYLDSKDKKFKDRDLFLKTGELQPAMRAAVELAAEARSEADKRGFLKYRSLFREDNSAYAAARWASNARAFKGFCVTDYFEDELGKPLTLNDIARIVTGSPTAISVPHGAAQHDIELALCTPTPLPVAEVTLTPEEVDILGYFARDLRELARSEFLKDGPGTIKAVGSLSPAAGDPVLETSSSDDEIRSFTTIFRRLYMSSEPANFQRAVAVFSSALKDHPYGRWAAAEAAEFDSRLARVPDFRPFVQQGTFTFSRKRLIDVFIYTRYAHQPTQDRRRQYAECLDAVNGRKQLLTWMFLTELWKCGLEIRNVGRLIDRWFEEYCQHHQVAPNVLASLARDAPGVGAQEKELHRKARLLDEKVVALANEIWERRGRPAGGYHQFLESARAEISAIICDGTVNGEAV